MDLVVAETAAVSTIKPEAITFISTATEPLTSIESPTNVSVGINDSTKDEEVVSSSIKNESEDVPRNISEVISHDVEEPQPISALSTNVHVCTSDSVECENASTEPTVAEDIESVVKQVDSSVTATELQSLNSPEVSIQNQSEMVPPIPPEVMSHNVEEALTKATPFIDVHVCTSDTVEEENTSMQPTVAETAASVVQDEEVLSSAPFNELTTNRQYESTTDAHNDSTFTAFFAGCSR